MSEKNQSNFMNNDELTELAQTVYQLLLEHFGQPEWRNPLPPIDELVSTILSQNTNDRNRDLAFDALREKFPSWEMVKDADTQEVIECIRIAGLANRKGPRIQRVLQYITDERGRLELDFLRDFSHQEAHHWLTNLEGVGPKTAAIVMQFSLGMPAFPVDTHIHRVSGRIGLRPEHMNAEQAHEHLAQLFLPEQYYAGHLNLIRLGREICKARKPECSICPLKQICRYNRTQEG